MRTNKKNAGTIEMLPLSQDDLEILIYMTSDIWITPDLKRFKKGVMDGLENKDH